MIDACNEYRVINDNWRTPETVGYKQCNDKHLAAGWYRFILNGQNAIMATSAPASSERCNTWCPIWWNGKLLLNILALYWPI